MERRTFLKLLAGASPLLSGCGWTRIDPYHVLIRSEKITTLERERAILSHGKLGWTADGKIRVLYLHGKPYYIGYQHGAILREEIQDNFGYLYKEALKKFKSQELFAEAFERMRPHIPEEYMEEMHGLAHGSKMPLHVIHHLHALPELSEWGGKKKLRETVKLMMSGELGTSCSNIGVTAPATVDGGTYAVRALDWGLHRISKLHQYPVIMVVKPCSGVSYANITWAGFIGAISGMNAEGITLGEMGYGDPPNETLSGKPMPFLLRDVLSKAHNLKEVRDIIEKSRGTSSFGFLMSDGKTGQSELYIKDSERFLIFKPGVSIQDGDEKIPGIEKVSYGGHDNELLTELLRENYGKISPELLMQTIIPKIAMKSNFQNVVYDPARLRFWLNFAPNREERAAEQPYTLFDLGQALKEITC